MDEAEFKERAKRIQAVNKIVAKLDPAVRSQAFELLEEYVTEEASESASVPESGGGKTRRKSQASGVKGESQSKFFARIEHSRPSEALLLIVADHFRQYGSNAFSLEYLEETAEGVGLTIPARPNMTLRGCKRDGKTMFKTSGRGHYKPTVSGETWLKETYEIKKGTAKSPDGDS